MSPSAVSVFTMAGNEGNQYIITHLDGQFLLRTIGSGDEVWQPLEPTIDDLLTPLFEVNSDPMIAVLAHEGEHFERLLVAQHRNGRWQDITVPTAPRTISEPEVRSALTAAVLRLVEPPGGLASEASG